MNVGLLLPAGLLALVALALPIALHLVRQSEQRRVEFAALRWLSVRARPRRRPRLDEWLLLLLRLLMVALIALWLAQPVWFGATDTRPWLLVHPAIDPSLATPLSGADEQRRWLAPGFPAIAQPPPASTASIGSLLRELDATLPAQAAMRVLVPAQFDATDAERPALRRRVEWIAIPATTAFDRGTPGRVERMLVHADPAHREALPYLRAAATAWAAGSPASMQAQSLREIAAGHVPATTDTHLIWLADAAVPASTVAWVRAGGVALLARDTKADGIDWGDAAVAWRGDDGTPLAQRVTAGSGAWVRLLAPLNAQSLPALLEPRFPLALHDLLQAAPGNATRTTAEGYAPVGDAGIAFVRAPRSLDTWLAWLIVLLFGIERWLAASPRRNRA